MLLNDVAFVRHVRFAEPGQDVVFVATHLHFLAAMHPPVAVHNQKDPLLRGTADGVDVRHQNLLDQPERDWSVEPRSTAVVAVVVVVAPFSSCKSAHGWLGHRAA